VKEDRSKFSGVLAWDAEEPRLFARAIHGHPTISSFDVGSFFPYESLDALYSALATLPALKWIGLSNLGEQITPEDESALAHPESLTELLRVPSLRTVRFYKFYFTSALCQAAANALMEDAVITNLRFRSCSFSAEGSATILASALSRNTSVSLLQVVSPSDDVLGNALAAALPSNTT
jgi:hypothetical protein